MRPSVAVLAAAFLLAGPAGAAEVRAVIADFDHVDTSGEPTDQSAAHARRIAAFADILAERLDGTDLYAADRLACGAGPCSAGGMPEAAFVDAVREAGARIVVYGGVHKMSTLVQTGKVHVLDVEAERLLLDRSFTFRGDTDVAYARAAEFIVDQILESGGKR